MTSANEFDALRAIRLRWFETSGEVWRPAEDHVSDFRDTAERKLADGIDAGRGDSQAFAIVGQQGAGKTHLLGWAHRRIAQRAGFFFLVELLDPSRFWQDLSRSMLEGLLRPVLDSDTTQLDLLLRGLLTASKTPRRIHRAVCGVAAITPAALDEFVNAVAKVEPAAIRESHDTLRALVLYGATDPDLHYVGHAYLTSQDEPEANTRLPWRIRSGVRAADQVVRDLLGLLALAGRTVIAFDQLEPVVRAVPHHHSAPAIGQPEQTAARQIADGLMTVSERAKNAVVLVACLGDRWEILQQYGPETFPDRFELLNIEAGAIPTDDIGRALVAYRFAAAYRSVAGFSAPYATWPIADAAFAGSTTYTPRRLLQRVHRHVQECLDRELVLELADLDGESPFHGVPTRPRAPIDATFRELRDGPVGTAALGIATDEPRLRLEMPALLGAALHAWIVEHGLSSEDYVVDVSSRPIHAILRRRNVDDFGLEHRWAFVGITAGHWATQKASLDNARAHVGHYSRPPASQLFVLRNTDWHRGPVNAKAWRDFLDAGGRKLEMADGDLRVFAALNELLKARTAALDEWLVVNQPASQTQILREALLGVATPTTVRTISSKTPDPSAAPKRSATSSQSKTPRARATKTDNAGPAPPVERTEHSIRMGKLDSDGKPLEIELDALRRHTTIFGASGSGKTVLIRRLVEECALRGVSAIVLDPNNDLARLGDVWPQPPVGWTAEDSALAKRYHDLTEVVVWTPGHSAQPLSFQPLPDFDALRADADEFRIAIDLAVATLAVWSRMDGSTSRADQGRAVLKQALVSFANLGRSGLSQFVDHLADLPDGVSTLSKADRLAEDMVNNLRATMVNQDDIVGGKGDPVDPGVLLTPSAGKRARVSVISFIGLADNGRRQTFVNLLQRDLFRWLKRNPAPPGSLTGMFVMDEAQTLAPSGMTTVCSRSTIELAQQARKYGLALVFATQAPKGISNELPGNSANQFFGRIKVPVQIEAARQMARAHGFEGDLAVGGLSAGSFYAVTESVLFEKAQMYQTLSYHTTALTNDEVADRARRGAG